MFVNTRISRKYGNIKLKFWHTRGFKFTKRVFTKTHNVESLEAINMAVVEMVWDTP
jgi:hypothetical protein